MYIVCVRQWQQVGLSVHLLLARVVAQLRLNCTVKYLCMAVHLWMILVGRKLAHPKHSAHCLKNVD